LKRVALAASAFAFAFGCGQITGLSDDYTFDLDASGVDAGNPGPNDAGRDVTDAGPPETCSAQERAAAQAVYAQNAGEAVPAACRSCLAQSCCEESAACGADEGCAASMKCLFECQRRANPAQCSRECRAVFDDVMGACVQRSCSVCSLR